MYCQACGRAGADRVLEADLAGQSTRLELCTDCAERLGINPAGNGLPLQAGDLFAALLDPAGFRERDARSCPVCSTSFAGIRRSGRVGCMRCYEFFGADIRRLLTRLGGRQVHAGQLPSRLAAWRGVLEGKEQAGLEDAAGTGTPSVDGLRKSGPKQDFTERERPEVALPGSVPARDGRSLPSPAALAFLSSFFAASEQWRMAAIDDDRLAFSTSLVMYRNAQAYPFPARLSKTEGMRFLAAVERFFRNGPALCGSDSPWVAEQIGTALQRRFRTPDGSLACSFNDTDHFRLIHTGFGSDWATGQTRLRGLESALEQAFPFAVNLEWGHLSASLANLGTALRAGAWLHLPGTATDGRYGPVRHQALIPSGLVLEPGPFPGIHRLSNQRTLGWSETFIHAELARAGRLLLHYESGVAKARINDDPAVAEDRLWRLWGSLRFCRRLEAAELAASLAELRQGLHAGVFSGDGRDGGPVHWQLNALLHVLVSATGGEAGDAGNASDLASTVRDFLGS